MCGGCTREKCAENFQGEELVVLGQPLTQCPYEFIGKDQRAVEDVLDAADFAQKGCGWPYPGGWAEQTAACVDGVRVAWAAKREIEAREKADRPL
jgi:hypothetical protein